MRRTALLLLCLTLLSVGLAPVAAGQEAPAYTPAPCPLDPPEGLTEQDQRCGTVTVPLEHDDPDGQTIELFTLVVPSTSPSPQPDPVMFLTGGPGQAAVPLVGVLADPATGGLRAARADRDIIFVDQRGTGYSNGLDCPELAAPPDDPDAAEQALAACYARLDADADLDAFDTTNNREDLRLVARALGYEQVNLYGVSYGSKLGYRALEGLEPGDWVRSALLTSPIAGRPNYLTKTPESFQSALDHLYASCAADPGCAVYGDLRAEVQRVVDALEVQPAELPDPAAPAEPVVLTAAGFQALLYDLLFSGGAPVLPALISALEAGDHATAALLLLGDEPSEPEEPEEGEEPLRQSTAMLFSVNCAEELAYSSRAQVLFNARTTDEVVRQYRVAQILPFYDACEVWDVEEEPRRVVRRVSSEVPALVVAGAYDPITPPTFGVAMTSTLPNSQLAVAPSAGHSPLENLDPACADQVLSDFFADPTAGTDLSCTQAPPVFLLPQAPAEERAAAQLRLETDVEREFGVPLPELLRRDPADRFGDL